MGFCEVKYDEKPFSTRFTTPKENILDNDLDLDMYQIITHSKK